MHSIQSLTDILQNDNLKTNCILTTRSLLPHNSHLILDTATHTLQRNHHANPP